MKRIGIVPIFLALIIVSTGVHADAVRDARKAIQTRYDRLNASIMHKDIHGVEVTFTRDCVMKGEEGRVLRISRFLEQVKALFPVTKVMHASTKIVSIKAVKDQYQTVAEWNGESMFTGKINGKEAPSKPRKVSQTVRDTWKKTDSGWQIVQRVIEQ